MQGYVRCPGNQLAAPATTPWLTVVGVLYRRLPLRKQVQQRCLHQLGWHEMLDSLDTLAKGARTAVADPCGDGRCVCVSGLHPCKQEPCTYVSRSSGGVRDRQRNNNRTLPVKKGGYHEKEQRRARQGLEAADEEV